VSVEDVAGRFDLPLAVATRLVARHGDRAETLLEQADHVERRSVLCECEPVTRAEVRHAVRHEHVERLEDLFRRVRCSSGGCLGMRCCWSAAQVMAEERGWKQGRIEEEVADFLDARWQQRPAVLQHGVSAAQEELFRGAMYSFGAFGDAALAGSPLRATEPG
jgi:glycerol-3-phosphate dehydrogenase